MIRARGNFFYSKYGLLISISHIDDFDLDDKKIYTRGVLIFGSLTGIYNLIIVISKWNSIVSYFMYGK